MMMTHVPRLEQERGPTAPATMVKVLRVSTEATVQAVQIVQMLPALPTVATDAVRLWIQVPASQLVCEYPHLSSILTTEPSRPTTPIQEIIR